MIPYSPFFFNDEQIVRVRTGRALEKARPHTREQEGGVRAQLVLRIGKRRGEGGGKKKEEVGLFEHVWGRRASALRRSS